MEVTTNIDLSPEQLQLVLNLTGTHLPGVEILAYGSRVRGNSRCYSDLELVAFANKADKQLANNLREPFEESDLPIPVDLFLWDEIQGYAVLQQGEDPAGVETS